MSNIQQTKQTNQHNILIQYLDQFGKQISTRKNNNALQQQLSSLSKAYNSAQEKLLQTEKALINETILIEKQRSIIELYKYILREDMQDDGILTFIQHLEENQQQKRQIYDQLTELKTLLSRKRVNNCKKSLSGSKNVRELKNEVQRLQCQQKTLSQQSIFMSCENDQLKEKVNEMTQQIAKYKQQMQIMNLELANKKIQIQKWQIMLKMQKQDNLNKSEKLGQLSILKQKYNTLSYQNQRIIQIIQSRLNITAHKLINKQNNNSLGNVESLSPIYIRQIDQKLGQLEKYKQNYKKIKQNYRECEFHKRQISLLKLFISQEALQLFKEYDEHHLDCLQTEIRNLAVLQKNKLMRLQQCQRNIWKYRIQLIKEEQQSAMTNTVFYPKNRINSSKQASKIDKILSTGAPLIASVTANPNNVSQFDINP